MLGYTAIFLFAVVAATTHSKASLLDLSNSTFDRTRCLSRIERLWGDGIRNVTFNGATYLLKGTQEEPIMSPDLCPILCGGRWAWYRHSGPRLFVWLAPILFMIPNLQFQDLGRRSYLEAVVLFGNPIGFFLALFGELEVWRRSTQLAEAIQNESGRSETLYTSDVPSFARLIAIHQRHSDKGDILQEFSRVQAFWERVIKATEGVWSSDPKTQSQAEWDRASLHLEATESSHLTGEQREFDNRDMAVMTTLFPVRELIHQFDRSMSMSRRNDLGKVLLAGLIYCISTIAPYVPELSNEGPHSGTKVGPALLLTFILFGITFTNAIGDYPRRHARRALECFFDGHSCRMTSCKNCAPRASDWEERTRKESVPSFEERSMCVYRPRMPPKGCRRWAYMAMSGLAVAVPFIAATFVLATAPMSFKYRNRLVFGVFGGWVFSVLFDGTLSWLEWVTGERLFWVCMMKNMAKGILAGTTTIFTTSGLGKDCHSWLNGGGKVELNPLREFKLNTKVRYPASIGTVLLVELAILILTYVMNRETFRTIWR